MLVLFLDLDGVFNSENSFMYNRLSQYNPDYAVSSPNPMSVKLLDYVLYVTGAKIVVSSSWRGGSLDRIKEVLYKEFGLIRVDRVIDQTPRFSRSGVQRGEEIQHWLDSHKVDNYVILDDDSDMLDSQKNNFVQTTFKHGFTTDDMHKVFDIFGLTKEEARVFSKDCYLEDFIKGKNYYKDCTIRE